MGLSGRHRAMNNREKSPCLGSLYSSHEKQTDKQVKCSLCQMVISVMERKNVMERVCGPGGEGYQDGLTVKQTSQGGEGVGHGNKLGEEHPRRKRRKCAGPEVRQAWSILSSCLARPVVTRLLKGLSLSHSFPPLILSPLIPTAARMTF